MAQDFMSRCLDRRKPFNVLWDPHAVRLPRVAPAQLRIVRELVEKAPPAVLEDSAPSASLDHLKA